MREHEQQNNIMDQTIAELNAVKTNYQNMLDASISRYINNLNECKSAYDIADLDIANPNYELAQMELDRVYNETLEPTVNKVQIILHKANKDIQSLLTDALDRLEYDKHLQAKAAKYLDFLIGE